MDSGLLCLGRGVIVFLAAEAFAAVTTPLVILRSCRACRMW